LSTNGEVSASVGRGTGMALAVDAAEGAEPLPGVALPGPWPWGAHAPASDPKTTVILKNLLMLENFMILGPSFPFPRGEW